MLVSDLAYRDMEGRTGGLLERFGNLLGRIFRRPAPAARQHDPYALAPEHAAHLRLVPAVRNDAPPSHGPEPTSNGGFRWRRHPQLLKRPDGSRRPDAVDVARSARSAAVRGLFLARSGRFRDARAAFAVAARESSIDLTAIPGFWGLPRTGMMAAVHAYEDVERYRDAAALGARIRLTYRPPSISALPNAPDGKTTASGS